MRKGLWNKDFILLLQGNAISTIGDVMYSVAIGYWVYERTGSSALMGIMTSISLFVTMLLSPFCGSIVDKCNRKWVIVGIDVLQGLLMVAVGVLAYLDALNVPIVLLSAFLAAIGSVFYSPAISTLLIDLIPKEDMVRGQSIHSGISSLIDMCGTAFSGVMVAFFGVPLIVVLNGISNLYSAATELFVRVPKTVQQGEAVTVKGMMHDLSFAAKSIFSDPCLRVFIPTVLILNLLGAGPLTLMLPFSIEKGFTVDMYGYLVSIYSLAMLAASLLLGVIKLTPRVRFGVMSLGFTLSIPATIAVFFSTEFVPMCIFAFIGGVLNCAGNTVFISAMMLALPEQNRSAILGFIRSASVGGTAISAIAYGFLGDLFPLYLVFAVGSAISLLPMIYLSFHPAVKRFILTH